MVEESNGLSSSHSPSPSPSRLHPTYAASLKSTHPLYYDHQPVTANENGSVHGSLGGQVSGGAMGLAGRGRRRRHANGKVVNNGANQGANVLLDDESMASRLIHIMCTPPRKVYRIYSRKVRPNAPFVAFRMYHGVGVILGVMCLVIIALTTTTQPSIIFSGSSATPLIVTLAYLIVSSIWLIVHCLVGSLYLDYVGSVIWDIILQIVLAIIVIVQLVNSSSDSLTSYHYHYITSVLVIRILLLSLPITFISSYPFSFFQIMRKPWRLPLRDACYGFLAVWIMAFLGGVLLFTLAMNQFPGALQKRCLSPQGLASLTGAPHFCATDADCPNGMLCRAYASALDYRSSSYDDPLKGMVASLLLFSARSSWHFYFTGLGESLGYFQSSIFVSLVLVWFHFLVPSLCLAVCLWQVPQKAHSDEAMSQVTKRIRGRRDLSLPLPSKRRWWKFWSRIKEIRRKHSQKTSSETPREGDMLDIEAQKKALKQHHLLDGTEDDTLTSLSESAERHQHTVQSRLGRIWDTVFHILDSTLWHLAELIIIVPFIALEIVFLSDTQTLKPYKYILDSVFLFLSCVQVLMSFGRLFTRTSIVPIMWTALDMSIVLAALVWVITNPTRIVNLLVLRFATKSGIVLSRALRGKFYDRFSRSFFRALQMIIFVVPLVFMGISVVGVDFFSTAPLEEALNEQFSGGGSGQADQSNTPIPRLSFSNYAHSFLMTYIITLGDHWDVHLNALLSSPQISDLHKSLAVVFYSAAFFAFFYILMNVLGAAIIREFLRVLISYKDIAAEQTPEEKHDVALRHNPTNKSFSALMRRFSSKMHQALPHRLRHSSSTSFSSSNIEYDTPMLSVHLHNTPVDKVDSSLEVITSSHRHTPRQETADDFSSHNNSHRDQMPFTLKDRIWFLPKTEPARRFCWRLLQSDIYTLAYTLLIVLFLVSLFLERPMEADYSMRVSYPIDQIVFDGLFLVLFSVDFVLRWLANGIGRQWAEPLFYLDMILQLELFVSCMSFAFKISVESSLRFPLFSLIRVIRVFRPLRFFLCYMRSLNRYLIAVRGALKQLFVFFLLLLVVIFSFALVGNAAFSEHGKVCSDGSPAPCSGLYRNQLNVVTPRSEVPSPFRTIPSSFMRILELMTLSESTAIISNTLSLSSSSVNLDSSAFWQALYLMALSVFLTCFVLYLPLSIIFFHVQKSRLGGGWRMAQQREWTLLKQWTLLQKPVPFTRNPRSILRKIPYYLTTHFFFRIFFALFLVTSIVVLNFNFSNQPEAFDIINFAMTGVILLVLIFESVLHLIGLGFKLHFSDPLRKADVGLVILLVLSPLGYLFDGSWEGFSLVLHFVCISFVIVRMIDMCRLFRPLAVLVLLLEDVAPALLSMLLLLVWLSLSFSMLGVQSFGQVRFQRHLNWQNNLRSMPNAMRMLFYLFVWHDWKGIVSDLSITSNCTSVDGFNDCGSMAGAFLFALLIFIVVPLVILNLCVSVILDHYALLYSDMEHLTVNRGSVNAFISVWSLIDPYAEGRAPLDMLRDLNKIIIQQNFHSIAFHRLDKKEKKAFRLIHAELQFMDFKPEKMLDVGHIANDYASFPLIDVPRKWINLLWNKIFTAKRSIMDEEDEFEEHMTFQHCLMLYLYHRIPQTALSPRELRSRETIMKDVARHEAALILQKWYMRLRRVRKRSRKRQKKIPNATSVSSFSQPTILSSVGHQAPVMEDVSEELESVSIAKLSIVDSEKRIEPESTSVVEARSHSQLSLRSLKSHGSIRSATGEPMGKRSTSRTAERVTSRMSQSSGVSAIDDEEEEDSFLEEEREKLRQIQHEESVKTPPVKATPVKKSPISALRNPFSSRKKNKMIVPVADVSAKKDVPSAKKESEIVRETAAVKASSKKESPAKADSSKVPSSKASTTKPASMALPSAKASKTPTSTPPVAKSKTPTAHTTVEAQRKSKSPILYKSSHHYAAHSPDNSVPLRYSGALQRLVSSEDGEMDSSASKSNRTSLNRLSPDTAPLMSLPGTPLQHRISTHSFSETSKQMLTQEEIDQASSEDDEIVVDDEGDITVNNKGATVDNEDDPVILQDNFSDSDEDEMFGHEEELKNDHRALSLAPLSRMSEKEKPRYSVVDIDQSVEDLTLEESMDLEDSVLPHANTATMTTTTTTTVRPVHGETTGLSATAGETQINLSSTVPSMAQPLSPSKKKAVTKGKKGGAKKKGKAKKGAKGKGKKGKKGGKKTGKKGGTKKTTKKTTKKK
eukprot:CAMPEP_0117443414 /NCGR_PEP_ID=MMETSP0759-20121206/4682_1 /TAXON_ID=63605 /ORGANISM="Percolomonas cosmopolitus, Strain WS" /LENGTH=2233 /DNA_ID=CAMNT_0005235387 /DNA_START=342 /DNA_END=7043 /DNA_ORIENTATION=+